METAGIPTELIDLAHKLVKIKGASTATLGHLLELDSQGQKRTCTTRESQITQTSFWRLEREGLNNKDIEVCKSLLGTGDIGVVEKVIKLGEQLFCYMQEDLPAITNRTQGQGQTSPTEDNALALRELNQQIREKGGAAQGEINKRNRLANKITKAQRSHEPMIVEIRSNLNDLQTNTQTAQTTLSNRHNQLT